MTEQKLDLWVEALVAARATSQRFVAPADRPSTSDEAYRIQASVARCIGDVGGFKTARKSGAPTIMAPIFAADIVPSGAQVDVNDVMGVELEVGLMIAEDCPPNLRSLSASELSEFLCPVAVIELVDTRVQGPYSGDDFVKLADNQINAGLVIGAPVADRSRCDFRDVDVMMQAGADIIVDGRTTVPGGSALETFAGLAHQIGSHCGGLKRGQIVITGSLHPLVYYPSGTFVQGSIAGIGEVSVTLGE